MLRPIENNFFSLLNEYVPQNNKVHKIFNTNTIKLSYSCMTNMKQKIDNHNNKKLRPMKKIKRNLLEIAIAQLKENVCKRELRTKP